MEAARLPCLRQSDAEQKHAYVWSPRLLPSPEVFHREWGQVENKRVEMGEYCWRIGRGDEVWKEEEEKEQKKREERREEEVS